MIPEVVIAAMLMDAGIEDVFVKRPSVLECADPVTVGRAEFKRDAAYPDGERGTFEASIYICREVECEAADVAGKCQDAINNGNWERYGDGCIVTMDAAEPKFDSQDSSGRYVYEVEVSLVADKDAR